MVCSQLVELKTPPRRRRHDRFSIFEINRRQKYLRAVDMQECVENLKTIEDEHIELAILTAKR